MSWGGTVSWFKRVAGRIKDAVATVSSIRIVRVDRKAAESEQPVTEFISKDHPGVVDDTASNDDVGAVDDAPVDLEPPAMRTQVRRFVPSLID